jgi:hypothetical protein
MRFIILSVLACLIQSTAFASTSGSGFEGTYKVERLTQTSGSWKNFWLRVDMNQLQEVVVEEIGTQLYIGLKDANGLTWSANYGVCTGSPGEYCNANKSADGKTLKVDFWGDWSSFAITLGENNGQMVWTAEKESASLAFDHSRK